MARGVIYNPERSRQIKDFSGLRYGTITPTDLDGLIDFGNKIFVYMEFKCAGIEINRGQELAIERIVDDHKRLSIGIVALHNTSIDEAIDTARCTVSKIRFNRRWYSIRQVFTVKQIIDRLLARYAPEYLKEAR